MASPVRRQETSSRHERRSSLSATVVKTLGLFSGVQAVTVICSVIRAKFVALWLGPIGVGLFGIYNTALDTLVTITQLGMRHSAVRDVAALSAADQRLLRIAWVIKRWAQWLGLAGASITIAAAPWLSQVTFGDYDHTFSYILLGISVLLSSLTNSRLIMLQGMRRFGRMARASVWGAVAGLAVSLPMFYWWGIRSVIPSIIAYTLATYVASILFRQHLAKPDPIPSAADTYREGIGFIRLGIYMTLSVSLGMAANYAFIAWLNRHATPDQVGYFQSGYTIVTRYIGLIFSAIMVEYYPRVAKWARSRQFTSTFVCHEMLIGIAAATPLAMIMMAVDSQLMQLLYDSRFVVVGSYLSWSLAGTVLRVISWCMAVVIIARGDGRIYLVTEGLSAVTYFGLSVAGWQVGGLAGLGIAYTAWYSLYMAITAMVYFRRYRLSINRRVALTAAVATLASVAAALLRHADLTTPLIVLIALTSIASLLIFRRLM